MITMCMFSQNIMAQLSSGGTPPSFRMKQKADNVPMQVTKAINLGQLAAEDLVNDDQEGLYRFAKGIETNYNFKNSGEWTTLANGDRIWRLKIHSPDALSMYLEYENFHMPKGAMFFLYDIDREEMLGSFTSLNNTENGKFTTGLIYDNYIVLEYFEPAAQKGKGSLNVSKVYHGYRGADKPSIAKIDESGDCQRDVKCPEGKGWEDERKGVARIMLDGGTCTGSLINNTKRDNRLLLLTANHCFLNSDLQSNKYDATFNSKLDNIVFTWNYEKSGCGTGTAPTNQTTTGATIIANYRNSDFALLELRESPERYNVCFNGFDATTGSTPTSGVGIHHPSGDVKKISQIDGSLVFQSNPCAGTAFGPETNYYGLTFKNDNGTTTTEGGSSGSPLFNSAKMIVGQLFGGAGRDRATGMCDNSLLMSDGKECATAEFDVGLYGKLSVSWDTGEGKQRSLGEWLDPVGKGKSRVMPSSCASCEKFDEQTIEILCGETITSSNFRGKSRYDTYGECTMAGWESKGRELIYKLTNRKPSDIVVTINEHHGDQPKKLNLMILSACNPGSCVGTLMAPRANGNQDVNTLVFEDAPVGDYYIVVDGNTKYAHNTFDLTVECVGGSEETCPANAHYYEDFESYRVGKAITSEDNVHWSRVTRSAAISNDRASNGKQSLEFNRKEGGDQSVNLDLGQKFTGVYRICWDMYIEPMHTASFGVFGRGENDPWGTAGDIFKMNDTDFQGKWLDIEVFVDLDKDKYTIYYNNREYYATGDYLLDLDVLNFYGYPNAHFYVDRICYSKVGKIPALPKTATAISQQRPDDHIANTNINESIAELSIFPNPTTGLINIAASLGQSEDIQLDIFSQTGQLVKTIRVQDQQYIREEVNLNHLANGLYLVRMTNNTTVTTKKILLQK